MKRASGVLLHISSLANPFGIGSFGKSAYDFVDFLHQSKQAYWQILPLTTTSYGDSPYQSFSAFAGNTHFIDLDLLAEDRLLDPEDYAHINFGQDPSQVDYAVVYQERRPLLEKAVAKFLSSDQKLDRFHAFCQEKASWLDPYAEFMAIKEAFGQKAWYEWDAPIKFRQPEALNHYRAQLSQQISYHKVTQFFFFQQWAALKAYANAKQIEIIGDIPIYVAQDSVEMWQSPQLFKVDENQQPITVSGTPPDNFSDEGQYWGNPIYDWAYHKDQGYAWWVWRMEENFKLYDIVRIDHFRGFESFWQVPYGAPTAAQGQWTKGPGAELFTAIRQQLGDLKIIAEDLGFLTQEVKDMLDQTGYPGMKVLQFGFNGQEDSIELPHNYPKNCVAYVGTHDNMTAKGWYYDNQDQAIRDQLDLYLNRRPGERISQALNRGIAASVADTVIYTMQDLLDLGNEGRMNEPSTIGGNWAWRLIHTEIPREIQEDLLKLTQTYFRENHSSSKE